MTRRFHEFLRESKRISGAFDPMHAEEYFAGLKDRWDCIPQNAREWKLFTDQYQDLCDAYEEERLPKGVSIPNKMFDPLFQQLKKKSYKHSLYEVLEDSRNSAGLRRALSMVGISSSHCHDMMDFLQNIFDEAIIKKKVSKLNLKDQRILTSSEIRNELKPLGLSGWKIRVATLDELNIEWSDEEPQDALPLTKTMKHKIFICTGEDDDMVTRMDIVAYPGFFQITYTEGGNDVLEPTPNEKLAESIAKCVY